VTRSQRIALAIIKFLLRISLSWKVDGKENVPSEGPFIMVANHVHLVDPILLISIFPQWINFMAKEELFRYPFLRIIIRWGQAFSVHRRGTIADKQETMNQAKNLLNKGLVLGMFPEGKRNHNGKLLPGKPGSVVIASRMGIPLLPVGIVGTEKLKGASWLWKRPGIVVNIGQPFKLPPANGRLTKSQTKSLTDLMMKKIAALLPRENRGVYGD
jgi:1-acyl-sn-glycerol-3-phosphate acyltransferase